MTDHNHPGLEAAMLQLAANVDELTDDIDKLTIALGDLAQRNATEHAEYRADIERLYASFSDHLRNGHGA